MGKGSLGKVNIITLATLLPTPIIISLGRPRWRHCIAELEVLREVLSEDTEVPVGNVGEVLGGALVEGAADDHSFHLFVCILYM